MNTENSKPIDENQTKISNCAELSKKPTKVEVTHTDFMNFTNRFYESVTFPLFLELTAPRKSDEPIITKDHYKRFRKALKTRLCNCYIFDDDVPLEDVQYDTELLPLCPIENITEVIDKEIAFFSKHSILGEFESTSAAKESERIRRQTSANNRRRQKITAVLRDRLKISGYFHAYEAVHKELESIYRRILGKKKRMQISMENEFIEEQLNRTDEFFEKFGGPEQFTDDAFNFEDVLGSETLESTEDPEFAYFL
ncbi:hypothetical protein PAEPH01_1177 [Pancytospora epiphaga]|nr:hypothetical protein PAEPH01_1177 [Pancytospora epiphaga]